MGFWHERTERVLIYEYMPDGSLDKVAFAMIDNIKLGKQFINSLYIYIYIYIVKTRLFFFFLIWINPGLSYQVMSIQVLPQIDPSVRI